MRRIAGIALIVIASSCLLMPLIGSSQQTGNPDDEWCETNRARRDVARFCEVREFRLDARDLVAVDGGANGGIEITGWDRNEILVRAKVEAWSDRDDPGSIVDAVEIVTDSDDIRAEGPNRFGNNWRDGGWAVSFDLMVPFESDLRLDATNGGIVVSVVTGDLDVRTTNGGIRLDRVAGEVYGRTTNGGIQVELDAEEWQGRGLDLQTTNGGVTLDVPAGFKADLVASTVNGGIRTDFPIVVQGRFDRRHIEAELNGGGPPVRLGTVNGGVSVRER